MTETGQDNSETRQSHEERLQRLTEALEAGADPASAVKSFAEETLASLTPDEADRLKRTATAKHWDERAKEVFGAVADLINEEPPLVSLESKGDATDEYLELVTHVLSMWLSACDLFERGSYPLATFLAIASIEETGKVGIARMQALSYIGAGWTPPHVGAKTQMRSHRKKHFLAAAQGAFVNTRLDRVLGLEHVAAFLDDVESGAIEPFRQSCLYADRTSAGLHVPEKQIDREVALRYVVLGGELMAEVLGWEPQLWEWLLGKVKHFEERHGLVGTTPP